MSVNVKTSLIEEQAKARAAPSTKAMTTNTKRKFSNGF